MKKKEQLEERRRELLEMEEQATKELRKQFHRIDREHARIDKVWRDYVTLRNSNSDKIEALERKILQQLKKSNEAYCRAEEEQKRSNFAVMEIFLNQSRDYKIQVEVSRAEIEEIKNKGKEARRKAEEEAPGVSEAGLLMARKILKTIKDEISKTEDELVRAGVNSK